MAFVPGPKRRGYERRDSARVGPTAALPTSSPTARIPARPEALVLPRRSGFPFRPEPVERSEPTPGGLLVIGRDIEVKGKIGSCKTLVIEGRLEAEIEVGVLRLAEGATFVGEAVAVVIAVAAGRKGGFFWPRGEDGEGTGPPAEGSHLLPPGEHEAYLFIADISGYTRFIEFNATEMAHAQFVLDHLLGALWDAGPPDIEPLKTEGDAILFTGPAAEPWADHAAARALTRLVERYYRTRTAFVDNNGCTCRACASLPQLDLKVVGHRGRILVHEFRNRRDVLGLPVIVVHRLLKNSLDGSRYVALTEAAALPLALGEADRVAESYDDVGTLDLAVQRFDPAPWLEATPDLTRRARAALRHLP